MAAILCDLEPGDEVVMPSFTFVSTANAFVLRGAVPVFVDIRPDTLNLDERLIEAALTPRTRALVPVHYAGVPCEMDAIMALAARHGLIVVEDAAQALLSDYRGRRLGAIGHLGCLSFHETKNVISGEGGALLVNDPRFVERAEIVREKGTNRAEILPRRRRQVHLGRHRLVVLSRANWSAPSCSPSSKHADEITARRRRLCETYDRRLRPLRNSGVLRLPYAPDDRRTNGHLYHVVLANQVRRDALIRGSRRGHPRRVPLRARNASPMGQKLGYREGDLPVTESISSRLVRLPLYLELSTPRQQAVVDQVIRFLT